MNNSNIEIYKSVDGQTEIKVKLENETVWLNLNQIGSLFERDKSVISRHISNVFKENELDWNSVKMLGNVLNYKELSGSESLGLLKIISDYAYALEILDQYDYQSLKIHATSGKEIYQLTYAEAFKQIQFAKMFYGNSKLFGNEKDDSFMSSVSTIYQTFDGKNLYLSVGEKAANSLYFITKNHSFSDRNKRIAAFLFLNFMDKMGFYLMNISVNT